MTNLHSSDSAWISQTVPLTKKREFLQRLSEDEFRDRIIRPLYERRGARCVRENCGADERGVDAIFVGPDAIGEAMLIAVQTKRGDISQASDPGKNINTIVTQLRMAAETPVVYDANSKKQLPSQVHLCSSGKISAGAREYIFTQVGSHSIKIFDVDEISALIDEHLEEVWLGVSPDLIPYARRLREQILNASDDIRVAEISGGESESSPVVDGNYLPLRVCTIDQVPLRVRGQLHHETKITEFHADKLLSTKDSLALITADGGSGKSTLLRRLSIKLLERIIAGKPDTQVPVLVRASDIGSGTNILNFIAEYSASISGSSCPFSDSDLRSGKVCLFVDALDEVESHARDTVLEKIVEFKRLHPKCRVILTSRDYKSVLDLSGVSHFTHYRLMPVTVRQAEGLIKKVSENRSVDSRTIKKTLAQLESVHGMQLSPILITAYLASPDFSRQDVPPNITEIFKKFTELMLGRWDEKKGLKHQHHSNVKDHILKTVALMMMKSSQATVSMADFAEATGRFVKEADLEIESDTLIDEIIHRSGILATDGRRIWWRHRMLMEFFAGRALASDDEVAQVIGEESWRLPILFRFGERPGEAESLLKICQGAAKLDGHKLYAAAISAGIAVQACYLSSAKEKLKVVEWVVERLSLNLLDYCNQIASDGFELKPLLNFLVAFFPARDAVGCKLIGQVSASPDPGLFEGSLDAWALWRIVGLLEARDYGGACDALNDCAIKKREYLLAIMISISWAVHLDDVPHEYRKELHKWQERYAPVVEDLRQELVMQFKSLLVDYRQGKIVAVEECEENGEGASS